MYVPSYVLQTKFSSALNFWNRLGFISIGLVRIVTWKLVASVGSIWQHI